MYFAYLSIFQMFMFTIVLRPPSLTSLDNPKECIDQMRVELLPFSRFEMDELDPGQRDAMEEDTIVY